MFELVFVACTIVAPESCEEKSLAYLGRTDHFRCMIGAPQYLADWVEDHPAWRIASWRCRDAAGREIRA